MIKKIIITGSNGLLGQSLVNLLMQEKEKYRVVGFSRGVNRANRKDFKYESFDITDKKKLFENLKKHKPNFIVNTAAMTNVDACEQYKEECEAINVKLVENLKEYAKQSSIHIIHISTDFIFDGKNGPYSETDKPNPLSYYGLSKLKSEEILIKSDLKYTILRTILVYGKVNNMSRNNIVLWIIEMLKNKKEITIVNDQFRMPTYVEDLAKACKSVIDKKATGTFNVSSSKLLSIYQIATQVAEVFKLDETLIKPISSATLNQRALRPAKTGFILEKTKKELNLEFNKFKEDLQIFKEKITQN